MASNPPEACCTIGVKHEGSAAGQISKTGDYEVYTVYPRGESTRNAILLLTDVIGHEYIKVQLVADQFAQNGYFVYMPDLFHKDPAPLNPPEGFDFMGGWLPKHGEASVEPIVEASLKEMREKYGCKNIGGVGYCFGAKYVVRHLKKGQIDAGWVGHPSFVTADELEAMENPLSISAAETDQIYPAEKRHETEAILQKKDVPYQQNLFSDVSHGFAVRCDISNKRAKFAKEQAFLQAVHWFDEFIKVAPSSRL